MDDKILTVAEAAKLLDCTVEHLSDLAHRGEVPGTKFGRSYVFLYSSLVDTVRRRLAEQVAPRSLPAKLSGHTRPARPEFAQ